jgi:hypothetical protein
MDDPAHGFFTSQAGHAGGLLFGLLFGLAFYRRPRCRRRPVAGAIAGVLFGVLPIAYVAFPLGNAEFCLERGERAWRGDRRSSAAFFFGMARRLDPGNPLAGARLAQHRDDPSMLEGLRPPEDLGRGFKSGLVARALLEAHLDLAARRLGGDLAAAQRLAEKARAVVPADAVLWARFGEAAKAAGRDDLALAAIDEARKAAAHSTAQWVPARQGLGLALEALEAAPEEQRLAVAARSAELAQGAAMGLAVGRGVEKDALEEGIALLLEAVARVARAGDEAGRLSPHLVTTYRLLANNTADEARRPAYLWQGALWMEREAALGREDPENVRHAARGALEEAAAYGDEATRGLAEAWFRERGLPVPEGNLAPPGGDR